MKAESTSHHGSLRTSRARKSRGSISPPALRRTSTSTSNLSLGARSPSVSNSATSDHRPSKLAPKPSSESSRMRASHGTKAPSSMSSFFAPTSPPRDVAETPLLQREHWEVGDLVEELRKLRQDINKDHAEFAAYEIEKAATGIPDIRTHTGRDLFANIPSTVVPVEQDESMRVKFRQHLRNKKDQGEEHHVPICLETHKQRVPPYRFHHVEIDRNILTPMTATTHVTHHRDLRTAHEEKEHKAWVQDVENNDKQSGFPPMKRETLLRLTAQKTYANVVSQYIDTWLQRLDLPEINVTPFKRFWLDSGDSGLHQESGLEKNWLQLRNEFPKAFDQVFASGKPEDVKVNLRQVLKCSYVEEAQRHRIDPRYQTKLDEAVQSFLSSYTDLGCAICFTHACEHGDFDADNYKKTFGTGFVDHLRRRRSRQAGPRQNQQGDTANGDSPAIGQLNVASGRPWTEDERGVLMTMHVTAADHNDFRMDTASLIAAMLDRSSEEVVEELRRMNIALPAASPPQKETIKSLSWYDRHRKALFGNWSDHLKVHEYQMRDLGEPCAHEGPCRRGICGCVNRGLLCEKFCGCTLECCAYKFNGCACHGRGDNCHSKQKDKPCICLMLNRECDPDLCGTCGVLEAADPAGNAQHHKESTKTCQNCELQSRKAKAVTVGTSQLEGVGYGLYAAEPIAQDEFVIEYTGEVIMADEGTKRTERRRDIFNPESHMSYIFTLLEHEGLWVDAAGYGSMSRFINHAPERDTVACNITPKIVYVNGEFRIKFIALRDIRVGEELFFNYGEDFPNLNKKLLDTPSVDGDRLVEAQPGGSIDGRTGLSGSLNSQAATAGRVPRKRKRANSDSDREKSDYVPSPERSWSGRRGKEKSPAKGRGRAAAVDKSTSRIVLPVVKPKGKRGGARPGSGRPRKYPRPEPVGVDKLVTKQTAPEPAPQKPPEPSRARQSASAEPKTPEPTTAPGRPSRRRSRVVADSQEDEGLRDDEVMASDEGGSDGDGDTDSAIKMKQMDRATRNRRPPAKFKDDEVWAGNSQPR